MISILFGILQNEDGQGLIEYGLIITFIALAVFGALALFGDSVNTSYEQSTNTIETHINP